MATTLTLPREGVGGRLVKQHASLLHLKDKSEEQNKVNPAQRLVMFNQAKGKKEFVQFMVYGLLL